MVLGLLPLPIHGICHKQTLTCMGRTYTLNMTTLVGPWQEIAASAHQILSWTCCLNPFFIGLLVSFISINNTFIRVHAIIGFPTNASIKEMIIISGSYKTYPYTFQAQNLGNVVIIGKIGSNENFPFKSLIFSWNSFFTQ